MNGTIVYRPHRSHMWFVPFAVGAGILSFAAAGYCLPRIGLSCFCFLIGVLCLALSKVLYDSSNIIVFFEEDGVRIAGGKYSDYRYARWEELAYAYDTRSYKGHSFLVLSPKALSRKQARDLTNRGANMSRISVDLAVVIYMDASQNVSRLRETINSKVGHIDSYIEADP